ncbi:MAG TPA: hypothetical protein VGP80_04050 [Gemmatimonadales bacterium]|jgi:hypothetical protein|nr:hypothetical protein [Gemmatimonadales bacterium]
MDPHILENVFAPLFALVLVAVSGVLVLRGPLGRALAKRIEGSKAADHDTAQRLEEVEARLQTLELTQERMLELEERLDFAERLLAREKDPVRLGRPGAES